MSLDLGGSKIAVGWCTSTHFESLSIQLSVQILDVGRYSVWTWRGAKLNLEG